MATLRRVLLAAAALAAALVGDARGHAGIVELFSSDDSVSWSGTPRGGVLCGAGGDADAKCGLSTHPCGGVAPAAGAPSVVLTAGTEVEADVFVRVAHCAKATPTAPADCPQIEFYYGSAPDDSAPVLLHRFDAKFAPPDAAPSTHGFSVPLPADLPDAARGFIMMKYDARPPRGSGDKAYYSCVDARLVAVPTPPPNAAPTLPPTGSGGSGGPAPSPTPPPTAAVALFSCASCNATHERCNDDDERCECDDKFFRSGADCICNEALHSDFCAEQGLSGRLNYNEATGVVKSGATAATGATAAAATASVALAAVAVAAAAGGGV